MKKLFSIPFVQFIFLGGIIFLVYYLSNPVETNENFIIVDNNQLNRVVTIFKKQWNRNPTEEELNDLLQARVNEEILYREALKMGLDKNDEIVKRRLSQKFEFLTSDMANLQDPSSGDLKEYYHENKHKYLIEPTYSYAQIFISVDERDHAMNHARKVQHEIKDKEVNPELLEAYSDMFPIALYIDNVSKSEIVNKMGDDFYEEIENLEPNTWSDPFQSAFGLHLVYITAKNKELEPEIDVIAEVLKRDYLYDLQSNINKNLLNKYKSNYTIEVNVTENAIPTEIINKLESNVRK